ncbi:lipopolysaccharide assembly outer membrane protein LptD (OstA) [Bradyrhizobium elkanii]|nr:lipopolysaccharide assembly outer membrane protein LptD (OstA) [Bradyrhizobium elkanii]
MAAFGVSISALLAAFVVVSALDVVASTPAAAQAFTYNPRPPKPPRPPAKNDGQMLVQATEVDYDYNNQRISAVGNVQMFYNGTSVEADKVIYDQKTKRLHAEGNIRMTDAEGKITYANIVDLSDDYRDGFVDSLRVDTEDQTRMAATRADRSSGNYTVFDNGVYTACAPCKDDPKKPPLWQVKGARIIHNQTEKMLYFENAQLEFFGVPMAYLPYFSTPDPTVKRKSGFLMPGFTTYSAFGVGVEIPYYFALAPDFDATFNPRITSKQGVLFQGEFRQRLSNGAYQIRLYGIDQLDQGAFAGQPGDRQFRGGVETKGQFALNDKWTWGWDGVLLSDYYFMSDYRLAQYKDPFGSFLSLPTEAISQLYLTGVGNRSFFDARAIYYLSYSGNQNQVPVVAPVIDYNNVINSPIFGGEFSYKVNFTNLTRETAVFDPITAQAANPLNPLCTTTSADPMARTPSQCLLRGMPGTYTRLTAEAQWRKSYTDPLGQIWTPFVGVRADAINADISNQPGVSNFLPVGDTQTVRLMPTVGFEYRYPLHQRAAVGHDDRRADRAGHYPAQRARRRQASERGRAEPGVRHLEPVRGRQVLRLRPRRGRQPRQCRRAGHHTVRSRRQRQGDVRTVLPDVRVELVRGRGRHQHRHRLRPAESALGLCREPRLLAQPHLHVQRPLADGRGDLEHQSVRGPGQRELRPLVGQPDVRRLCRAAGTWLFDAPRGHPRQRIGQGGGELGGSGRGALGP